MILLTVPSLLCIVCLQLLSNSSLCCGLMSSNHGDTLRNCANKPIGVVIVNIEHV